MARWFSIKPAITLKGRKFKGLSGWSGKPLHPPLTDFPVTCYVLVGLFDIISYALGGARSTARDFFVSGTHVIIAGAAVSVGTALTGFWDCDHGPTVLDGLTAEFQKIDKTDHDNSKCGR